MTAKPRIRVALAAAFSLACLLIVAALSTLGAASGQASGAGDPPAPSPPSNGAISPQDQADALHLVIAADRELYCRLYNALQTGAAPPPSASASGKSGESWPLPCEMFRRAAESIQSKGAEFSFALRSLRPIDQRNGPQTELEQRGLAFVASHPNQNYYGREMLGGRRYFTAVYPDIPAAAACVDCHGRRSAPIAQHYQVGEAMGGVVVRVPLEF
ncbi:MAG TPA: DUF3365 domain-containing protein [Opitutaceae bacterium]|nr:DUF3365 domain-containing protein [Opitutaceae bacterium]